MTNKSLRFKGAVSKLNLESTIRQRFADPELNEALSNLLSEGELFDAEDCFCHEPVRKFHLTKSAKEQWRHMSGAKKNSDLGEIYTDYVILEDSFVNGRMLFRIRHVPKPSAPAMRPLIEDHRYKHHKLWEIKYGAARCAGYFPCTNVFICCYVFNKATDGKNFDDYIPAIEATIDAQVSLGIQVFMTEECNDVVTNIKEAPSLEREATKKGSKRKSGASG